MGKHNPSRKEIDFGPLYSTAEVGASVVLVPQVHKRGHFEDIQLSGRTADGSYSFCIRLTDLAAKEVSEQLNKLLAQKGMPLDQVK